MVVPQVFELQARPSQLAPNHEVQKVLWGDVADMYSGVRLEPMPLSLNSTDTEPSQGSRSMIRWCGGLPFEC